MGKHKCWMAQTFVGLEFLHLTTETMFRDLKPANLIFDGSDRVKITDFGVSKNSTSGGQFTFAGPAGSPGYVSPELLREVKYGPKTDWYSFGVLLWVVTTGGISAKLDPQPPTNAPALKKEDVQNKDYSAIFDDYKTLISLIESDGGEDAKAPPITGDARNLVLKLVIEAESRLDALQIRSDSYMLPLQLPPPG